MIRTGCTLLLALFLTSCGSKEVSDQQISFKDKKWQKSQVLTYDFNITDTATLYTISATIKHFKEFPFDKVKLSFSLADPSGENRTTDHDLVVRNEEGGFLGKKKGDTILMKFAIRNHYRFKAPGKAKVTLVNRLPYPEMEGIGGISIVVKKK
jgi:gliding motility-associated lipoprotein GldH